MAPIHDRMPVILSSNDCEPWLNVEGKEPCKLDYLFEPLPDGERIATRVSTNLCKRVKVLIESDYARTRTCRSARNLPSNNCVAMPQTSFQRQRSQSLCSYPTNGV